MRGLTAEDRCENDRKMKCATRLDAELIFNSLLDKLEIWREELVMGRGPFARCLLPEKPSKTYRSRSEFIARLREAANTGDLYREWIDST